jgi:hypothetical protein
MNTRYKMAITQAKEAIQENKKNELPEEIQ